MERKYEVSLDGKPLVVSSQAPERVLDDGRLVLRMDDPGEWEVALRVLAEQRTVCSAFIWSTKVDAIWKAFTAHFTVVQAGGGAVSDEFGRLLVIHRNGRWDLPKGKIETDEDVQEGAVREVQEECGLSDVHVIGDLLPTWHTYTHKGKECLKRTDWYMMQASSQYELVPQQEEGISEVRWADDDFLATIRGSIWPSLLPVINAWEGRRNRI